LRWLSTQRRVRDAHVKRVCYCRSSSCGPFALETLCKVSGDLVHEARATLKEIGLTSSRTSRRRKSIRAWATAGWAALPPASSTRWRRCATPRWATGSLRLWDLYPGDRSDGGQREIASSWLKLRNVWETPRGNVRYVVRFAGRTEADASAKTTDPHRWVATEDIHAIGFDQLIPGNRSPTVNHLRLWSGRAITPFHIEAFNAGDYTGAVREQIDAKNLSRVLYPDDSTPQGRELRLKQQYFFVSASLQDILANHLGEGRTLDTLPTASPFS